ncbi:MAG: hydantoinase/oxoprolinase family protein [Sphingomonadaceae bacterium]|nr:hydantoinase/oxoprolinase family protein [Sphingomonadaceae bacterium]
MTSYMLAMDVGGTFLDTVVADSNGGVTTTKVLSTHEDYSRCISAAVQAIAGKLGLATADFIERCSLVINGTTVATNVLAQLKGPRVGALITRGFADTQYIGRIQRWGAMDLAQLSPLPMIVPRDRILELDERVDRGGNVVRALDRAHVEARLRELVEDHGVEAVAVSLLWSFVHPDHEQLVKRVAAELYPDLPVSISSEVFPAMREYERTNTTVIDAFIAPGVRKYLRELERYFRENGFKGALRLVHAAGGVSTADEVRGAPVTLINSGPVAGYVGAMKFGGRLGRRNIITADVGGTSFDAGMIVDGRLAPRHRTMVPAAGHPSPGYLTGLSMMDVSSIGTGGGSIGWIDARDVVRVGPQSAGSNPGPACFGVAEPSRR